MKNKNIIVALAVGVTAYAAYAAYNFVSNVTKVIIPFPKNASSEAYDPHDFDPGEET